MLGMLQVKATLPVGLAMLCSPLRGSIRGKTNVCSGCKADFTQPGGSQLHWHDAGL